MGSYEEFSCGDLREKEDVVGLVTLKCCVCPYSEITTTLDDAVQLPQLTASLEIQ